MTEAITGFEFTGDNSGEDTPLAEVIILDDLTDLVNGDLSIYLNTKYGIT